MARFITILTLAAITLWTLLSLGAWTLLSLGGDLAHSQLDSLFLGDPETVPAASAIFRFLQTLGLGLVVAIWLGGAAVIWFFGFILRRIARSVVVPVADPAWGYRAPEPPRQMKDVTPPRPDRALPRD